LPPRSPSGDSASARAGADDREAGSAALEFIVVGLLLLVPLVYLTLAMGLIQQNALGTEAAARHIGRGLSTAPDARAATTTTDRILGAVVDAYDLEAESVDVTLSCRPDLGSCPRAGATVFVTVRSSIALPLVPPVLGLERFARVAVEATSVQKVSRFWSGE
jgi:hypothetical protein